MNGPRLTARGGNAPSSSSPPPPSGDTTLETLKDSVRTLQTTSPLRRVVYALAFMATAAALTTGIMGITLPPSTPANGLKIATINGVGPVLSTGNLGLLGGVGVSVTPGLSSFTIESDLSLSLVQPVEFLVAGSPVDGSGGTITVSKVPQGAHTFWRGPTSGADAVPVFGPIVASDIPSALSLSTLVVSGDILLGGNTSCIQPILPSCYDLSNQQCMGGPLGANCLPQNAMFNNLVVGTLTITNGTVNNNGTVLNNTFLGDTLLNGTFSCVGSGVIGNTCVDLGDYTCPMGHPLAESCIPASLVQYDMTVTNNLTINKLTCAGSPIPTNCFPADMVVMDANATPKYPDNTNTKGMWFGLNTKANAFDSSTITLGDNAATGAVNTIAIGNLATTASIAQAISISAIGVSNGPVDAAHALSFGVNAASVLPGSLGLSLNGATFQVEKYSSLYATTATAGATTTLTVTSAKKQRFSGTLAQTVVLPVVTTLAAGFQFYVINDSTGAVTVQTSGLVTLAVLGASAGGTATVVNTAGGTGVASWHFGFDSVGTIILDTAAVPTFPTTGDTKGVWYGTNTKANSCPGGGCVTVGNGATTVSSVNAVAIGTSANTVGNWNGIAIGTGSHSGGANGGPPDGSIAIGVGATTTYLNSIAIGTGAVAGVANQEAVAIGPYVSAGNFHGMSFGISITNSGVGALSLGLRANNPSGTSYNCISIGTDATTGFGSNSVALGYSASATGSDATTIGSLISNAVSTSAIIGGGGSIYARFENAVSVAQLTSLTTTTINHVAQGKIVLFSALGAGTATRFTVTNNRVKASSVISATVEAVGGTGGLPSTVGIMSVGAGSFDMIVYNGDAGATTAAPIVHFKIMFPAL
jgi:trimeric autotransporter adhesin